MTRLCAPAPVFFLPSRLFFLGRWLAGWLAELSSDAAWSLLFGNNPRQKKFLQFLACSPFSLLLGSLAVRTLDRAVRTALSVRTLFPTFSRRRPSYSRPTCKTSLPEGTAHAHDSILVKNTVFHP